MLCGVLASPIVLAHGIPFRRCRGWGVLAGGTSILDYCSLRAREKIFRIDTLDRRPLGCLTDSDRLS